MIEVKGEMSVRNLPIIALDFKSADEVHTFLNKFNEPLCVKIGMVILSNRASFN